MLQMARIWSLLSLLLPVVSGRCAWALLVSVSLAPVSSCGNARDGHGGAGWWQPPRFFQLDSLFSCPYGQFAGGSGLVCAVT